MQGQMLFTHSPVDDQCLHRRLTEVFGQNSPTAGNKSNYFSNLPADAFFYQRETPDKLLFFIRGHDQSLQAVVEPLRTRATLACQETWHGVQRVLEDFNPKLTHVEVTDTSGNTLLQGQSKLTSTLVQREVLQPLVILITTVIWLVIGWFTFAETFRLRFVAGGLTAVIGAAVAVLLSTAAYRKGAITWVP